MKELKELYIEVSSIAEELSPDDPDFLLEYPEENFNAQLGLISEGRKELINRIEEAINFCYEWLPDGDEEFEKECINRIADIEEMLEKKKES